MKNVLLDTNVVLDGIAAREPFRDNAEAIFRLVKDKRITAFITANSITDIYYLARKSRSEAETREALRILLNAFSIVDVHGRDCREALDFPLDDYEDALLFLGGLKAKVDCIVTRDKRVLEAKKAGLPVFSPDTFLRKISRK